MRDELKDLKEKYEVLYEDSGYADSCPNSLSSKGKVIAESIFDLFTGFCDHINYLFGEDDEMVTDCQTFEIYLKNLASLKPCGDDDVKGTKTGVFIINVIDTILGGELDLSDEDLSPIISIKDILLEK